MATKSSSKTHKSTVQVNPKGYAKIQATFNNIIITLTNEQEQPIADSWSSAGKMGFRGAKKNTPYAAQTASQDAAKKAYAKGLRTVVVHVKGPGPGREAAIRGLGQAGLVVTGIKDVTGLPHNGCRPPRMPKK